MFEGERRKSSLRNNLLWRKFSLRDEIKFSSSSFRFLSLSRKKFHFISSLTVGVKFFFLFLYWNFITFMSYFISHQSFFYLSFKVEANEKFVTLRWIALYFSFFLGFWWKQFFIIFQSTWKIPQTFFLSTLKENLIFFSYFFFSLSFRYLFFLSRLFLALLFLYCGEKFLFFLTFFYLIFFHTTDHEPGGYAMLRLMMKKGLWKPKRKQLFLQFGNFLCEKMVFLMNLRGWTCFLI